MDEICVSVKKKKSLFLYFINSYQTRISIIKKFFLINVLIKTCNVKTFLKKNFMVHVINKILIAILI